MDASSIEANSSTGGCCADRRPDGRGKFSRNVFQHETYFNKVAKCLDIIDAVHDDVTFESANSGFCERLVFESASENASMSSTLLKV